MRIGYARISTAEESLDPQKEALDRSGIDQFFTDVANGARAKRPQLEQALLQLREGDTLVVWKLDRLARTLEHLIETLGNLGRRGIGLCSLHENIDTTTGGNGEFVSQVFAVLAEVGRDLVRERTKAGRAAARARGHLGGRKPKLDEKERVQAIALHKDPSNSIADICRKLRISRASLYRYLRVKNRRTVGGKPKAKFGEVLSTDQGRKLSQNAPQTVDNPKHSPTIARADSSSPHPPAASAVASPRPVATAPSRPMNRVPAEGTAAQPPGFKRQPSQHGSSAYSMRR